MAHASKKKAASSEDTENKEKTLEQLMLDRSSGKYSIVGMAAVWAGELRRREEYRHLSQNEILELALQEVLNDKVSAEEIKAAHAAAEAQARSLAAAADHKEKK